MTVQENESKSSQAAAALAATTAKATENGQSTLPVPQQSGYSLSSMINGFGNPSSSLVTYGGGGGTYLNNKNTSSTVKPRDYMTAYSSPTNSTDLIYRCPVIECGKGKVSMSKVLP